MITADEFADLLRAALWQHIKQLGSVEQAARILEIGKSTLYQFLAGETDPGLSKVLEWAAKLGLPPESWFRKTGAFPQLGSYSDLLYRRLNLGPAPADQLLRSCVSLSEKLPSHSSEMPAQSLAAVIEVENLHLKDPASSPDFVRTLLTEDIKRLREQIRSREKISCHDVERFYLLLGSYGLCCYSSQATEEWAWSLAISLNYFEQLPDCPCLTWQLIDASMLFQRFLKPEESLDLASLSVGFAARQDVKRLLPRALLNLGSILFHVGEDAESESIYDLVVHFPTENPYKSLAVFSRAAALAKRQPEEAAGLLSTNQTLLDQLPPKRQVTRYWTQARVLVELKRPEEAFLSLREAINADPEHCDARDLFLMFDEARELVGSNDERLGPIAVVLKRHLRRLSYLPEAFLIGKKYLDYLEKSDDRQLRHQISRFKKL